jgi:hypothetical protein
MECPWCAMEIERGTRVCPFCKSEVTVHSKEFGYLIRVAAVTVLIGFTVLMLGDVLLDLLRRLLP